MLIKNHLSLLKPGIIVGNLVSTSAGVFLAAKSSCTDLKLVVYSFIGVAFVVASGCVINNIYDSDIDKKMTRTKNRPMAMKQVGVAHALIYALVLLLLGTMVLYSGVNRLTVALVLLGYISYVFLYTMWYKRTSPYGTLIGSISGAVPPLAGYSSVSNHVNLEAILLSLLFCVWQMPHSYAIAIFRMQDYSKASVPVLPIVSGTDKARCHMMGYVALFDVLALALYICGNAGDGYFLVATMVCLMWTHVTFKTMTEENMEDWSRSVFRVSLLVVTSISAALGIELIHFPV